MIPKDPCEGNRHLEWISQCLQSPDLNYHLQERLGTFKSHEYAITTLIRQFLQEVALTVSQFWPHLSCMIHVGSTAVEEQ